MTTNSQKSPEKSIENNISWKSLMLRIFLGYILIFILGQIFYPYPVDDYWTATQKFVGSAVGYLAQYLLIFLITSIVAILIARIPANNRNKPLQLFLNKAFILTIVISGIIIYGGWYITKKPADLKNTNQKVYNQNISSEKAQVIATITSQDAEGGTSNDLDQAMLKNLESWIVQTISQKAKYRYEELGYDPNNFNPEVIANSVYINIENKKLAEVKVRLDNAIRSVTVIGIEGPELIRVNCTRKSNHDIALSTGPCNIKIEEAFGVSLNP